jgi:hypothetical protein
MAEEDPRAYGEANPKQSFPLLPFFILGPILLVVGLFIVPAIQADMRASSIRGYGAERSGKVVHIEDTGNRFNDDPVVIVTLEVEEKGKKYRSEVKDAISPVYLPRFQPGATVKVWINPENPSEMALEEGL